MQAIKEGKTDYRFVFAYGSLLNKNEALATGIRQDVWRKARPALLRGFKRIYNKKSVKKYRGYTVLNIERSPNHSILGLVLGPLTEEEFGNIGKREMWSIHYKCAIVTVEVLQDRRNIVVYTSIANPRYIGTGKISEEYKKKVEKGIRSLTRRFNMPEFIQNYKENTFNSEGRIITPRL